MPKAGRSALSLMALTLARDHHLGVSAMKLAQEMGGESKHGANVPTHLGMLMSWLFGLLACCLAVLTTTRLWMLEA